MADDTFWGCAHVWASQERRAVDNLQRQGFRALFPFFIEHRTNGAMPQALFPGYVFIPLDLSTPWGSINSTRGVIRLLTSPAGIPQRVSAGFAESLERCLVPNPWGPQPLIASGAVVRIRRGPLVSREGIVRWSRERRLGLLFSMFNREVEVEFGVEDVEVLEESA
jgi:transcription antitermination factor NusG